MIMASKNSKSINVASDSRLMQPSHHPAAIQDQSATEETSSLQFQQMETGQAYHSLATVAAGIAASMATGEEDIVRDEERRAKNRQSAHKSRLRKRMQLRELQEKNFDLMEELNKLKAQNRRLSLELDATKNDNSTLRSMYQESVRLLNIVSTSSQGFGANLPPQP